LKPKWWGSPLVQEKKYQEKPVKREEIIIIIIIIIFPASKMALSNVSTCFSKSLDPLILIKTLSVRVFPRYSAEKPGIDRIK
jgi:hypothetical protein